MQTNMKDENPKRWADISDEDSEHEQTQTQTHQTHHHHSHNNEQNQSESQGRTENHNYSNNYGGERGGNRGGYKPRENKLSREEEQERTIQNLKRLRGKIALDLYNISYDADEKDIRDFYQGINITKLESVQKGSFIAEFENIEEAMNLVNFKDDVLKKRTIKIRVHRDFNEESKRKLKFNHKRFKGSNRKGYERTYNKKNYDSEPRYKKPYNHQTNDYEDIYNEYEEGLNDFNEYDEAYEDYERDYKKNKKYYKGPEDEEYEDKGNYDDHKYKTKEIKERKPIGFKNKKINETGNVEKEEKIEKPHQEEKNNAEKPHPHSHGNPFGNAKPRDENEFLKKKEEITAHIQTANHNPIEKEEKVVEKVIENKPVEENRKEEDRGERKPYADKYKQSYNYKNEDREKGDNNYQKRYYDNDREHKSNNYYKYKGDRAYNKDNNEKYYKGEKTYDKPYKKEYVQKDYSRENNEEKKVVEEKIEKKEKKEAPKVVNTDKKTWNRFGVLQN